MFECAKYFLIQCFDAIPIVLVLYITFDFVGSLLFSKKY